MQTGAPVYAGDAEGQVMTESPLKDAKDYFREGVGAHSFLFLCSALVVSFGVWAYYSELDIVSIAVGEVIPFTQVKSIQHLEGGIVREILVREGASVKKDQPLVILESTSSGADVDELSSRLNSLKVDVIRLTAELAGEDNPAFPEDMLKNHESLVRQAHDIMKTRRTRVDNQKAGQQEAIIQREEEVKEITARMNNAGKSLKLLREQIDISNELLKDNLTNRMKHLELLKEDSTLRGKIDEASAMLPKAMAAINEARIKLKTIDDSFQEEVSKELEEKRRTLQELSSRMEKFADSLLRTTLRSPVDGVIKTMYVYTVGGVVGPGHTIVDVVPGGDRLVIEAKLPIGDIGFVHPGQSAKVQLASSDAVRFGILTGEVIVVSPDTIKTNDGATFYKVRIEIKQNYFERGNDRYQLVPGVQVTCSIQTGKRTVMQYILDPFMQSSSMALRER